MNFLIGLTLLLALGQSATVRCDHVCENGKLNVDNLLLRSEVGKLASQLSNVNKCPWEIEDALKSLNKLVNPIEGDGREECTQERVAEIRDYYFKYIDGKKSSETPKQIRKFFLAYGMRYSESCRHRMMNLLSQVQFQMIRDDFYQINWFVGQDGPMSSIIDEKWGFEKIVLPDPLVKLHKINAQQLFVRTAAGEKVKQYQALCQRRFKPIYDKLIMPLIELSKIGFNFKGQDVSSLFSMEDRYVYKWFRIVLFCEVLNNIVIVAPRDANQDPKQIKLLTKDEVEALRPEERVQLYPDEFGDIKPLEYVPKKLKADIGDRIWDPTYHALSRAVSRHHVSSPSDPSHFGLFTKLFSSMKRSIQQKAVKLMLKNMPEGTIEEDKYDRLLMQLQQAHGEPVFIDPEYSQYNDRAPDMFEKEAKKRDKSTGLLLIGSLGIGFLIIIIYGLATSPSVG